MGVSSRRIRLCAGVAFSAFMLVAGSSGASNAQSADAAQIKALQAQIDQLQRTVKELAAKQAQTEDVAQAAKKKAVHAEEQSAKVHEVSARAPVKAGWMDDVDGQGHRFLEHKKGNDLTFFTPGGEITAYGNFDVSLDAATKNAKSGPVIQPDTLLSTPGDLRSEISVGCRPSRPISLIWAFAVFSASPLRIRQFRVPVRSRHRHFGDARPETNQ